jgi:hypothetical protein
LSLTQKLGKRERFAKVSEYFNNFLSYSLPNAKSVVNKVNTLFYAIKNFIFIGKTGQVHL